MKTKYCKQCNEEITHNKKRRLCTECLKEESRESSKFRYEKKFKKPKKIKTGICKCGNKIEHNFKRLICSDCIKEENRNNYNKNRDKYYAERKSKREKLKDTRFCVICKTEFKTAHAIKCTCSDECSEIHRRKLSLENYYSKKVNKSNTK